VVQAAAVNMATVAREQRTKVMQVETQTWGQRVLVVVVLEA
jgi:hypothetical protein